MKKIINKKGDLLNNILTTVIAVVGLMIIIYGSYRLYSVYANQDVENAKTIANVVEARINSLETAKAFGDKIPASIVVKGIPGWFITGWGKNDVGRPDKCSFKTCICICPGKPITSGAIGTKAYDFLDKSVDSVKACQDEGICRFFEEEGILIRGKDIYNDETRISSPSKILQFEQSNLVEFFASKYSDGDKKVIYISLNSD